MEYNISRCEEINSVIVTKHKLLQNEILQGFVSKSGWTCGSLFAVSPFAVINENAGGFW